MYLHSPHPAIVHPHCHRTVHTVYYIEKKYQFCKQTIGIQDTKNLLLCSRFGFDTIINNVVITNIFHWFLVIPGVVQTTWLTYLNFHSSLTGFVTY